MLGNNIEGSGSEGGPVGIRFRGSGDADVFAFGNDLRGVSIGIEIDNSPPVSKALFEAFSADANRGATGEELAKKYAVSLKPSGFDLWEYVKRGSAVATIVTALHKFGGLSLM